MHFTGSRPRYACLVLALSALSVHRAPAQNSKPSGVTRWVVAADGNEARYRVREQLAGIDLPNDAIGRTTGVEGALAVDTKGRVIPDQSRFIIDLASLQSDKERRDGFIKRNTLQTDQYPTAVFVPTGFRNLRFPLPKAGDLAFQMTGNLTLHGVTRPVTWDVVARIADGSLSGQAKTRFTFADFGMEKPRVRVVLSVEDAIGLEYSFMLVQEKAQ